jgi:hypothetical protein
MKTDKGIRPRRCARCRTQNTVTVVNEQTGETIALCRKHILAILAELPAAVRRAVELAIRRAA